MASLFSSVYSNMCIKLQVGKRTNPYLSQNDMVDAFALLFPMILLVAFPCALILCKQMAMQIRH